MGCEVSAQKDNKLPKQLVLSKVFQIFEALL